MKTKYKQNLLAAAKGMNGHQHEERLEREVKGQVFTFDIGDNYWFQNACFISRPGFFKLRAPVGFAEYTKSSYGFSTAASLTPSDESPIARGRTSMFPEFRNIVEGPILLGDHPPR